MLPFPEAWTGSVIHRRSDNLGHQRAAGRAFRSIACPCRRRAAAAHPTHGCAAAARRGGVDRGQATLHRRTQVLPVQLAGRHLTPEACGHNQGAVGLRAGAPTTQGRAWARPLRGPLLDGAPPTRAHDHDGLRVLAVPSPGSSQAGKKRTPARRLSQACLQFDRPSSWRSGSRHLCAARTVTDRFKTQPDRICQRSAGSC